MAATARSTLQILSPKTHQPTEGTQQHSLFTATIKSRSCAEPP
jgi:hypothetical protein